MRTRLTLARETLTQLTNDDLTAVNGAAPDVPTVPVTLCVTYLTCNPNCHWG